MCKGDALQALSLGIPSSSSKSFWFSTLKYEQSRFASFLSFFKKPQWEEKSLEKRAFSLQRGRRQACFELVKLYLKLGDLGKAEAVFEQKELAWQEKESLSLLRMELSLTRMDTSSFRKNKALLQRLYLSICSLSHRSEKPYPACRASFLERLIAALESLAKAISQEEEEAFYQFLKGKILVYKACDPRLQPHLMEALAKAGFSLAYGFLANAFLEKGELFKAAFYFEKGIALQDPISHWGMASLSRLAPTSFPATDEKLFSYYLFAAKGSVRIAYRHLAKMYKEGKGTTPNTFLAEKYEKLAGEK